MKKHNKKNGILTGHETTARLKSRFRARKTDRQTVKKGGGAKHFAPSHSYFN